jgi:hypothetical protein
LQEWDSDFYSREGVILMKIKLILDGGFKTCCSVTSTETIRETLENWIPENSELIVIDKKTDKWEPDEAALLAEKHLSGKAYPLLYIDGILAMTSGLPNRKNLHAMINGEQKYGVDEKDIIAAANVMGIQ